jgi:hypothetical protein
LAIPKLFYILHDPKNKFRKYSKTFSKLFQKSFSKTFPKLFQNFFKNFLGASSISILQAFAWAGIVGSVCIPTQSTKSILGGPGSSSKMTAECEAQPLNSPGALNMPIPYL